MNPFNLIKEAQISSEPETFKLSLQTRKTDGKIAHQTFVEGSRNLNNNNNNNNNNEKVQKVERAQNKGNANNKQKNSRKKK